MSVRMLKQRIDCIGIQILIESEPLVSGFDALHPRYHIRHGGTQRLTEIRGIRAVRYELPCGHPRWLLRNSHGFRLEPGGKELQSDGCPTILLARTLQF